MSRSKTLLVSAIVAAGVTLAACAGSEAAKQRYLANGDRFAAQGKYEEAIVEYRNAIAIDDKFGRARAQLAEAYAQNGNPEGAYREYVRAADLLPDDLAVQKRAATLLFMAGQFEDVRTRAEGILRQSPKDLDAQLLYANALVGLKDLSGGVREIEEAVELDPDHAESYTNLALLKMAQGQAQDAEQAFLKAVSLDPKSVKAKLALTDFYLATGKAALAEQTLNEVLVLDPKDALANRTLAAVYIGTGRAAKAEQPLKLVVDVTKSARAKFALAEYYTRSRRAADARAILEPLTRDANTYADATTRLALLTYQGGDRAGATKMIDTVLSSYPSHPAALQTRARWYLAEGQPAPALERAKLAVNVAPRDVRALYLLGVLQALNGQLESAATSFNNVLRLNPRAAAAQVQLAQLRLKQGKTDIALGLANEAVANAPNVPEARLILARTLVASRDFVRAEVEINQLLRAFPSAPAVLAVKGTMHMVKGEVAPARAAFQRAYELEPSSIGAVTGLTALDVQQKQVKAARARIEARVAAEPKRAELLLVAAKVYVADGDLVRAEEVLRRALTLDFNLPEPYMMLTDIYKAQQRLDAARGEFEVLAQRNGDDIGSRTMVAVLFHAQNNLAEAKRRYADIVGRDSRAIVAANNLAWIFADERQNLDNALDLAQRTTEQLPDYAEAWDTLGWVFYRKQLPLLAIEPFETAARKDPANAVYQYHLGLALLGGGDRPKARAAFEAALKIQPGLGDAQRELKALDQ